MNSAYNGFSRFSMQFTNRELGIRPRTGRFAERGGLAAEVSKHKEEARG